VVDRYLTPHVVITCDPKAYVKPSEDNPYHLYRYYMFVGPEVVMVIVGFKDTTPQEVCISVEYISKGIEDLQCKTKRIE
jgi:hypothetical protein